MYIQENFLQNGGYFVQASNLLKATKRDENRTYTPAYCLKFFREWSMVNCLVAGIHTQL